MAGPPREVVYAGPLLVMERPRHSRAVYRRHLPWCLAAWSGLIVARWIPLPSGISWCPFLRVTGIACMFCGWPRSFVAISQGAWATVLFNAPLVLLLYGGVIIVALAHSAAIIAGRLVYPGPWMMGFIRKHVWWVAAVLVLLQWIYRLFHLPV